MKYFVLHLMSHCSEIVLFRGLQGQKGIIQKPHGVIGLNFPVHPLICDATTPRSIQSSKQRGKVLEFQGTNVEENVIFLA